MTVMAFDFQRFGAPPDDDVDTLFSLRRCDMVRVAIVGSLPNERRALPKFLRRFHWSAHFGSDIPAVCTRSACR